MQFCVWLWKDLLSWYLKCRYSLGIKAGAIVKEAKKALDNDCCVVIGLQTTGEVSPNLGLS